LSSSCFPRPAAPGIRPTHTRPRTRPSRALFDHVTVRVADRGAAERFYETVLTPLGPDSTYSTRAFAVWDEFQVAESAGDHPVTRHLHIAFVSPSREQVDAFWQAGIDAGAPDDGTPGPRPQYAEDYYGAYLRDPDGNSVEAVHHARRRRTGLVDHIWIRVGDLHRSARFYATIAPATGLHVHHSDPERMTLTNPDNDGSFTLVQGQPSENVHVAFPGRDEDVRRFYDLAVGSGYAGNGEPGERPRYHPGYVAAYVLDPDGNNIEVVDHHRD
jgi:catechol 2,3-dioxygenase-like lactoylglutathione lyase family enzyme